MSQIGVQVTAAEIPPAQLNPNRTATAFITGVADWGPSSPTLVTSLSQAASTFGTPAATGNPYSSRTTTNANLFDALDVFFREGGGSAYVNRTLPASGSASSTIALAPSAALTLTAQYPGVGGNAIFVAVTNNTTTYTITLQDASGNVFATSPALSTLAAGVAWCATTGLATAVSSGSTLPSTAAATAMASGSNGTTPTITQWTTAINGFTPGLGPGQIFAPGQTNTTLSGIWSALGLHAQNNNRVALCDMDDNASVTSLVSAIGTFGTGATAGYCGFWAGNLQVPGATQGTTRSVPPSPVIAALCARADSGGNPNQAAAGQNFPLQFVTQSQSFVSGTQATYSLTDLATLNDSGINGFQTRYGLFENYGFVAAVPKSTDAIYWQLQHARLRMALVDQAQQVGEPFVFSQLDGQGSDIAKFNSAIQAMLMAYFNVGALYGQNATDAFSVNTGSSLNTPASLQAGNLLAQVTYRPSPSAQLVSLVLNAIPITQLVVQAANPAQNQ